MKRFLLTLTLATATTAMTAQVKTHIEGTVVDRPQSTTLIVGEYGTNWRSGTYETVQIHDGHFCFDLDTKEVMPYEIVFADELENGSWRPIQFMAEGGTLRMELHPEESPMTKTIVEGGKESEKFRKMKLLRTEEFDKLSERQDSLFELGKAYTPEATSLYELLRTPQSDTQRDSIYRELKILRKENREHSPEMKAVHREWDELTEQRKQENLISISKDMSPAGYFLVLYWLEHELSSISRGSKTSISEDIVKAYQLYEKKYPTSWFTAKCRNLIAGTLLQKPGQRMFDFTANDLAGNPHTLYDRLQKGNIYLLDLWASWCGPCRRTSKSMIPLYEQYHDKGFDIIAVAREQRNTQAMERAMQHDGYLWSSLVDLNDTNKVWERLGVDNAAGGTWLLDGEGTILLVSPTAEQVEEVIKSRLTSN